MKYTGRIRTMFLFLPRWGRVVAMGALCLAITLSSYACAMRWSMQREIDGTDRDPATGVVRGTEAVWLHPSPANDTGRAVLLVHGFMGSRKDFNDLGPALAAAGLHVRMLRLPGCGTTALDFAQQTPETLLNAVRGEYKSMRTQYENVSLAGFSMGGSLSTLLASERKDIDRLVLISPYYGVTYFWYYVLPPEWWSFSIGYLTPYVGRSEYFVKVNRPHEEVNLFTYHVMSTSSSRTLIRLGRLARRPETLARVRSPVLLVMAEGDEAASPSRARAAFEKMGSADKQARWFTKRSNHHLLWDYDREEAKATIVGYLSAPPPGTH